jgi:hypothetical protein
MAYKKTGNSALGNTSYCPLFSEHTKHVTFFDGKEVDSYINHCDSGLNLLLRDREWSASSPEKQPLVDVEREAAGIQKRPGHTGDQERNFLPCSESNHSRPNCSLVTLLTDHLSF